MFLSIKQLADLLGLHKSNIYARLERGRFVGARKVGKAWMVPAESVPVDAAGVLWYPDPTDPDVLIAANLIPHGVVIRVPRVAIGERCSGSVSVVREKMTLVGAE